MKCPKTDWAQVHRYGAVVNNFDGNVMISRRVTYLPFPARPLVAAGTNKQLRPPLRAIRGALRDQSREKTAEVLGEGYQ